MKIHVQSLHKNRLFAGWVDPDIEDKFPDCGHTPHDTNHLFNCPDKPTVLQVTDLWTQPTLAKNFHNLDKGVT